MYNYFYDVKLKTCSVYLVRVHFITFWFFVSLFDVTFVRYNIYNKKKCYIKFLPSEAFKYLMSLALNVWFHLAENVFFQPT